MTTIQPWIRKHNYSKDYFETAYRLYSQTFISYPVTYYKLNYDVSILDDDNTINGNPNLYSGSYERSEVGEYSGAKFDKILMLPVHNIEQVSQSTDSGEKGLTPVDSMISSFVVPQIYGNFRPSVGDSVNLNYGLDMDDLPENLLMFTISNIDPVHFGNNLNLFKCQVKPSSFKLNEIEQQINEYYYFIEAEKRIYPMKNAKLLNSIYEKIEKMTSQMINPYYKKNLNMYLI